MLSQHKQTKSKVVEERFETSPKEQMDKKKLSQKSTAPEEPPTYTKEDVLIDDEIVLTAEETEGLSKK